MLGNAFRLRQDSDYEVVASPDDALAANVLSDAEQFVVRVADHFSNMESPE
jgi:hypothetical protein